MRRQQGYNGFIGAPLMVVPVTRTNSFLEADYDFNDNLEGALDGLPLTSATTFTLGLSRLLNTASSMSPLLGCACGLRARATAVCPEWSYAERGVRPT
jgi:hypothetical protein